MIVHFDVDAFYASVAQRDDPSLRGKPLAVAGSSRRAVVLTASYEARPYGVRSAIPLYLARERCPELIVVAPDFARYRESSRAIFAIFARGATAVEGLSLDEAYVAPPASDPEAALAYAHAVRAAVREEVGLSVSAGVATQKLLAKIASDDAKPDGLRFVEPGSERAYLAPLPIGRLFGVGPKTEARLREAGIATIGDLAACSDDRTVRLLGRSGSGLRDLARGRDDRNVVEERATRSISSETTFEFDLVRDEDIRAALRELADDVVRRLREHGLHAATIGIKLKLADRRIVVRQTSLDAATDDPATIVAAAVGCLQRADRGERALRLLGVRASALTEEPARQLSMML